MRLALLILSLSAHALGDGTDAATYAPPETADGAFFFEPFIGGWSRWRVSTDAEFNGEWKHEEYGSVEGDHGLVVGSAARRHAISTIFDTPFVPEGKGLVVQYELLTKNALQCGGAYLKLLSASEELSADGFKAETGYTIMFGPDKCGNTNKVHFILRHKSPLTGEFEEKHLTSPPLPRLSEKSSHLYTAIVHANNSVAILIDGKVVKSASLLSSEDFAPPVNPPKMIDDPEDLKPDDWIDDPKVRAQPRAHPKRAASHDPPPHTRSLAQMDDPEASKR